MGGRVGIPFMLKLVFKLPDLGGPLECCRWVSSHIWDCGTGTMCTVHKVQSKQTVQLSNFYSSN